MVGCRCFLDRRESNACELFPSLLHGMAGLNVYGGGAWQSVAFGGLTSMNNIVCDPCALLDAFENASYDPT